MVHETYSNGREGVQDYKELSKMHCGGWRESVRVFGLMNGQVSTKGQSVHKGT